MTPADLDQLARALAEGGAVPAMTGRAYVSRDAARAARVDRGLRVLQGGQHG